MLEVAIFASRHTLRIEERNMFYVTPLFLIALLLWIERGLPRPQPATAVVAVFAAGLPLVVPYDDFIGINAVSGSSCPWRMSTTIDSGSGAKRTT